MVFGPQIYRQYFQISFMPAPQYYHQIILILKYGGLIKLMLRAQHHCGVLKRNKGVEPKGKNNENSITICIKKLCYSRELGKFKERTQHN